MASLGHLVVGMAGGRLQAGDGPRLRPMLAFAALAMFPDLDGGARLAGAGAGSVWLHRGALHSLVLSAAAAALVALVLPGRRGRAFTFAAAFATAASHGLLDIVTHGGSGVMLLWPLTAQRFLAGWSPLAAAPMGLRLLSPRGISLMAREALLFSPLLIYALWPRRGAASSAREGAS
jgi:inner membrane protein